MNITHVVESLARGGLERMVIELVKLQHREGHRCQVICLFDAGSLAHELEELGIPVTACGKQEGIDMRALGRVRELVRAHGTRILHTHNAVAHYQAVLATCGLRLRVINTRHGMGGNRRARRREWFYRRALVRTNAVVAVCEAARSDAVRRGIVPRSKALVVPNGIDVGSFPTTTTAMRERLKRILLLPDHAQIIGTVGRLNWAKDQVNLIRAFRHVHDRRPDSALVLIGDGELREELEQYAVAEGVGGSVHFLGDRNDVRELLQGLDLFVLSSISEGYSMALLEACATGLPIIATDVGGNSEIVFDGRTGHLVPARDACALAEGMLELLRDEPQARRFGVAARDWVERHGSLAAMASRYGALYDDLPCDGRIIGSAA
ncbi:glycosyltransferase involved in cell wall biosynthesis [Luteibacter rhizovicinus]|uniref:Glycosyltransferase involved in cell wall biosynthesis n=1 Tax=Luteibacter rhizovicinus TaxID=242606 RepID=A0A4R3YYD3_9GAMM|nr:glycosyltransferase [Luteibacter rhizovicinus]TCV97616.1 glycosyltransferase involved in cell wall biosynthesis [Luteibacter rhizovicinus]